MLATKSDLKEFAKKTDLEVFAKKTDLGFLATKTDLANLKTDMANTKTEMIRWMFIFWVGQMGASFAFIMLFLKK